MYDIIIKNGTIIDGTGEPVFRADVGIKENKIVKIGELHNEKAEMEIDATDRIVCPGFVDVNNHSDTFWQIFNNPNLESMIYQGVTTIIGGNCGSSLAPLANPNTIASIQKWADIRNANVNWLNMQEFLEVVDKKNLSVNFGTLVGHGTLRRGLLKDDVRNPSEEEIKIMSKILEQALKSGAVGLSTGLIYTHAKLASKEELTELAKIVKKYDRVYTTHVRGEKEELIGAIDEALEVAKNSGAKLHISHLKAMGEKNWNLMDEALGMIGRAKERGIDVSFDVYPYTNTGSVLYVLLPDWVSEGGKKAMLARLKDPVLRAKVIAEMQSGFSAKGGPGVAWDYSKVEVAISPLNKTLARKKITEIAASQEKSVEEAVVDILVASEGRVITSMEVLSEKNIEKAIAHPLSIVSSNGSGYDLAHAKSGEAVHPRNFGTFARVLGKYVREKGLLSWEEAIRKMTSLPAEKFGLKNRGKIKEKYLADILVINRETVNDLATQENPYQYSQGIEAVVVNGKLVLENGKYLSERNGEIIKL